VSSTSNRAPQSQVRDKDMAGYLFVGSESSRYFTGVGERQTMDKQCIIMKCCVGPPLAFPGVGATRGGGMGPLAT
jgi:hypothetical protein